MFFVLIKIINFPYLYFQTGFSHICANGITPALELITDVPEIDVNLPDKEGNTPLIFAAQAGERI